MSHGISTTRLFAASVTALAALAVPALAADPSERGPDEAPLRLLAPGSKAALIAAREDRALERKRAIAARKRRLAPDGPFVPVVGKTDYGTVENAFGAARSGHVHSGHDMFAAAGTPLVAVADSVVVDAGSDSGQGNYVHLYDPKRGQTYIYMHMVEPSPAGVGDKLEAGEEIGGVGCTGSCWGDHLHFEIRDGKGMAGSARDPLPALRTWDSLDKPL